MQMILYCQLMSDIWYKADLDKLCIYMSHTKWLSRIYHDHQSFFYWGLTSFSVWLCNLYETNTNERLLISNRHDLQCKYEKVILMDPDLANKHNVEQLMWKSVYYQVIEVLRKQHVEDKDPETKSQLINLLHEVRWCSPVL